MPAISACVSRRRTLAGWPITSDRGGTFISSVRIAPAATIDCAPTRAVQKDRTHPDQALVVDRAAVDHGAMSDRHVVANRRRVRPIHHVDHNRVLDIGAPADTDAVYVAAHDGTHPDAALLSDFDVA